VTKETHTSFLYEKAGIFYKNILLDEFQDTSTMQWMNLMPLLIEILSSRKGKILIVGDAKQSIYRWRNGNMQLILNGVKNDLSNFWEELAEDTVLKGNYRSLPEVVEFNNRVFPALALNAQESAGLKYGLEGIKSFETIYEPISTRQEAMRKGEYAGYVECVFFQKKSKDDEVETEDEVPQLQLTADKIRELTTQFGFRLKDITILVRGHKDAIKIAQFLTSQEPEIQVLSAEALLYTRQQHIQLIIETLRFLMFPEASLHYAGLLYRFAEWHQLDTPQRIILEDWDIYKNRGTKEIAGTRAHSLMYQWLPFLKDEMREQLLSCNLTQLVRTIISGLRLQDQQDIYLQQFQDVVFKFQGNQPGAGIGDFLEWWEAHEEKAAINMPEGPDAVQIITIHKSKGLEFPVVIIPYADWPLVESNKGQFLWVERAEPPYEQVNDLPILFSDSKETHFHIDYLAETTLQIADALNMTYVAFTRAAEHLYVFSEIQKDEKKHTLSGVSQIGHLLYQTLKAQQEGVWEALTYHCGEKHPKEGKEKTASSKTIPIIAPDSSLEDIIGMKQMEHYNDERLLGNFIHDVLAQLTDFSLLESTIKKVSIKTHVKSSIVAIARERLIHCLQDAQLREWFSGEYESVSEHDIWWKEEAIRPDKILMKGDEAILLDFKTGKPEKKHEAQIKEYQEAIAALGIRLNASYLVYISELGQVEMREV
jgi:ATP-dependent exoDNAse (exonuclease V) beta subunit